MSSLRILFLRILATLDKRACERELDQEIRAHIELLVEENLRKGMSPVDARHAALRDFGGIEQTKETIASTAASSSSKPSCRTSATPSA